MESRTRKILLDAWQNNRLAAVHIDLQGTYYNKNVFEAVDHLSGELRTLNIPNIWVAWPDHESSVGAGIMTVYDYQRTNQSFEYHLDVHINAQDNEPVVTKITKSALYPDSPPLLSTLLDNTGRDTLLLDGVKAKKCLLATLKDGILTDKYNFVVISNASDIEDEVEFRDLARQASWKNLDTFDRRYHSATSQDVLRALRSGGPGCAP